MVREDQEYSAATVLAAFGSLEEDLDPVISVQREEVEEAGLYTTVYGRRPSIWSWGSCSQSCPAQQATPPVRPAPAARTSLCQLPCLP